MWDYQFKQQQTKVVRKKGVTPPTSQIKLNSTKLSLSKWYTYTAINSKLVNIVRIQKAQGTETTPTQPRHNINVAVAMGY